MCNFRSAIMTFFDVVNPILVFIPDIVYRESIPMGVMPDIFNRASILVFCGWIPAYNRGYDRKKMDTRLQTCGDDGRG